MRSSGSTLLLLAVVGVVLSVGDGSTEDCTNIESKYTDKVMTDFDADRYLGVWYEVARYRLTDPEADGMCITAEYTLSGINNVTVHNRMFTEEAFKDKIRWASLDCPDIRYGKLAVYLQDEKETSYCVLDTDYESYSIVWDCNGVIDGNPVENSWILSRNPSPTKQPDGLTELLNRLGLSLEQYKETKQDTDQCIVRKCAKNPFPDFDADQYLGVWYEIARFGETEFEDGGRCITVEYTLSGINNVTIHNRMYITDDSTFKDKVGWAKLVNANGREGQLEVHYGKEEANYLVLDTDNNNYAIVWACREPESEDETANITEASWILSRSAQLTPEVEQQVNNKLAELGLPRSRYTDTPQDPQQCVVSESKCNKPVLSTFDFLQYVGTWYEIARFGDVPLEEGGQCITAEYTIDTANKVTVHNQMYSKDARAFKDITGWAEINDPSSKEAKLTVHFPSVSVTAPYWVLDTDYGNYSIVWTCSESDSTESSWILSRSAQLTPEVEQQVNDKLEALGLPRSRYTDTPQDPQQCVVSESTACGKSALPEFDISQYVGTWYEIARFGDAPFEEGGQCVTAEYTLAGKNNLTVNDKMFTKAARAFKEITGWAELDDPDSKEAKLKVHFPSVPATVSYLILYTDYENYSILWACSESDSTAEASNITGSSWLLSRTTVMSDELKQQVSDKLEELGLSLDQYTATSQDQKGCIPKASKGGAAALGPVVALTLAAAAAPLFSV